MRRHHPPATFPLCGLHRREQLTNIPARYWVRVRGTSGLVRRLCAACQQQTGDEILTDLSPRRARPRSATKQRKREEPPQ